MIELNIDTLLAGLLLFTVFLSLGRFRLGTFIKLFAFSSFLIGVLMFSSEFTKGEMHSLIPIIATFLIKVIIIPILILKLAKINKIPEQLKGYFRPATTYFVGLGFIVLAFYMSSLLPNLSQNKFIISGYMFNYILFISISLIFLGLAFLITRKDIISQIIGILTLENGIALFTSIAIGGTSLFIEFGVFLVIIISVGIMSLLTKYIYQEYGTTDTDNLTSLID